MELVEPIRDIRKIEKMKKYLKAKSLRDYCLFTVGINSGLRVSDLLNLRVGDVEDERGKLKDRIHLTEQKTGKTKDFPISDTAAKALREYLDSFSIPHIRSLVEHRIRDFGGDFRPGRLGGRRVLQQILGVG